MVLVWFLQALIDLVLSEPFCSCSSVIVYCTRRQTTQYIAEMLRSHLQHSAQPRGRRKHDDLLDVECYHAGMTPPQRSRVQRLFISGRLRVVVATVAFGMGLDKPDVRAIIHYDMPSSIESYVQEIGRAGRDGQSAYCHVFLDHKV